MLSAASPAELLRTTLSPSDISFRAITYLPDELLYDIPETGDSALSLFQGFKASLPDVGSPSTLRKGSKSRSYNRKSGSKSNGEPPSEAQRLQRDRDALLRDLEVVTVRKVKIFLDCDSYCRALHRPKLVILTPKYRNSLICDTNFWKS